MNVPRHALLSSSPLEVIDARTLFAEGKAVRRHFCGLQVLASGRILVTFMQGSMPRKNDGVLMLTMSDNRGRSWSEPRCLFAVPGWDCFATGGPCLLPDGRLRIILGRYQFSPELGGKQPFGADWFTTTTDSGDEGETWSAPTEDINIFPSWSEFYGASNPIALEDGRLLWAVAGTQERDREWRMGLTYSDCDADAYSDPILIATGENQAFSDGDIVRLADGRLLCVLREHAHGGTFATWSENDGRTWSPMRPTGFEGANFKLNRLESGLLTCLYRDEDPARRGVSLAMSSNGGASWHWVGQLYAAPSDAPHDPGYFCGYPDMEPLGDGEYVATLHTYVDDDGEMCSHFFRLRERDIMLPS